MVWGQNFNALGQNTPRSLGHFGTLLVPNFKWWWQKAWAPEDYHTLPMWAIRFVLAHGFWCNSSLSFATYATFGNPIAPRLVISFFKSTTSFLDCPVLCQVSSPIECCMVGRSVGWYSEFFQVLFNLAGLLFCRWGGCVCVCVGVEKINGRDMLHDNFPMSSCMYCTLVQGQVQHMSSN